MTAQQKLDAMKKSRTFERYKKAFIGHDDVWIYNRILWDIAHKQLK